MYLNFINNNSNFYNEYPNLKNIDIIVISLPNSERYESIKYHMKDINYYLAKGINENFDRYSNVGNFCKYFCSNAMIGCALSHIELYKIIKKRTLIIEDDTFVDFTKLNLMINELNYDFVQLFGSSVFRKKIISLSNNYKLVNGYFNVSLSAYIITKQQARKLTNIIINIKLSDLQVLVHQSSQRSFGLSKLVVMPSYEVESRPGC